MFSGNTYTFMYTEKYNIYKKPKSLLTPLKKTQPMRICKPKLERTTSYNQLLNQKNNSNNEDKENCQITVSDDYTSSLGLELWSASWE
jgi:hypothetical protein